MCIYDLTVYAESTFTSLEHHHKTWHILIDKDLKLA